MNHSAPVSSSKNFMQLTNCFFAGIFLCLGSLHSQTIDKTKPVGSTGGSANSTASGGATYTMPIEIPPGTNGMQPNLSLTYNSQAGDRIAGYGWNISGYSAISRAGRNFFHNGSATPVNYTNTNDAFQLDGQRLFKITGNNGADSTVYGTEAETFSKVESFGGTEISGPDWFKVTAKDGTIMEFGHGSNTKLLTDNGQSTAIWLLNSIVDKNNNASGYTYNIDYMNRNYTLVDIIYTANVILATYVFPYNKVHFSYTVRYGTPINTTYDGGASFNNPYYNLDKITVTNDGGLIKTYQCAYTAVKNEYFLSSVQEKGSDSTTLNPTVFKYGSNTVTDDVQISASFNGNFLPSDDTYAGDFNGDGKQDVLAARFYYDNDNFKHHTGYQIMGDFISYGTTPGLSVYNTFTVPSVDTPAEVSGTKNGFYNFSTYDYDGDGKQDVLMTKTSTQNVDILPRKKFKGIRINYSRVFSVYTGLSYDSAYYDALPTAAGYPPFQYIHSSNNFFVPGDFDGDGFQDYILILGYNGSQYKAFFSSPKKGTVNQQILRFGVEGDPEGAFYANTVANAKSLIPIDFDGDGKTEILVVKDNQSYVLSISAVPATTGYFSSASVLDTITAIKSGYPVYPGDFNGDRKTDLLVRNSATDNGASWNILYSTGKLFKSIPFVFTRRPYLPQDKGGSSHSIMVADFNNDGKTDIWHSLDNSSFQSSHVVYYSNGLFFTNETFLQSVSINSYDYSYPVAGDYNGDGKTDMLTLNNGNGRFIYPKPFREERLLSKITNGLGAEINFNYELLTSGNVYSRSVNYIYDSINTPIGEGRNGNPYSVFTSPFYVLASQNAPNGIGGTANISYTYQDAVMHRDGRGFLGFKKNTVYDESSGNVTTTENEINKQFSVPYPVRQFTVNGSTTISENRFTNSFAALSPFYQDRRYTQHIDKTLTINSLTDAAAESINTYDDYGNITNNIKNVGSWNGTALTTIETETTIASYGIHNTPVPALPDSITVKRVRPTHAEVSKKTSYVYSSVGNVITKKEFDGKTYPVTTSYEYDLFGNSTKVTVTAGSSAGFSNRVSTAAYDPQGRFTLQKSQVNSDNTIYRSESFTYDRRWGKPLTHTTNSGLTTSYEYDGFGRLTKATLPEGYAMTQKLNWENTDGVYSLVSEQPGGGANVKIWYDILGREVKRQTSGFNNQLLTQTTAYDYKGNVVSQTKPYYPGETPITTTKQYDAYNRVTQVSNTASTAAYTYTKQPSGNFKITTTNGAGQSSSKTQDPAGRIVFVDDNGGQLKYSYDSWGNQLSATHASKTVISNKYDEYGRQTSLTDLNAGVTTYEYNGFGELVKQTDALNKTSAIQYDDFGRISKRVGAEGTTTYTYSAGASGRIYDDLFQVTGFAGEVTEYSYDNLRRPLQQKITVDGTAYLKQYAYDTYGNLTNTTYPSGVAVNDTYDRNSILTQTTLTDGGTTTTLFTANAMNSAGIYTGYSYGNGKTSQVDYNSTIGVPTRYYTPGIQDLNFDFNAQTGNLNFRKDAIKNLTETFTYDNLNRLTASSVNSVQQLATSYDVINGASRGNIMSKTDAGNYVYKTDKINAVAYVTNPAGAQTPPAVISTSLQQITYTPFQKTASIVQNGSTLVYTYAADMERIKSVRSLNSTQIETKYYFGAMEVHIKLGVKYIHYINAGNGLCAIAVKENGVTKVYYAYNDYLGSILTLTDNTGAIIAKQNFDPSGRYRNPDNWTYNNIPSQPDWLYRGFTGHEHLVTFALINMNGRMYDPVQGRMLSPDNNVSMPWNTQGYNRYGYANNNPLIYTDPDGNNPLLIAAVISALISAGQYTANVAFSDGGFKNWSWGQFGNSLASGAISGGVSYGIGSAFGPVGSLNNEFARAFAHGYTSGLVSEAFGGNFKSAFWAGGFGSLAGSASSAYISNPWVGIGASALSGGIGSEIGGGNFWEGAVTGATVGAFNHFSPHYVTTEAKLFSDQTEAYNYMWDNNYGNDGTIENGGFITDAGVLVLPNDRNNSTTADLTRVTLKVTNSGKWSSVKFNGKWLPIKGSLHTHPNANSIGTQMFSPEDELVAKQHLPNLPNYVLSKASTWYYMYQSGKIYYSNVGPTSSVLSGAIILFR